MEQERNILTPDMKMSDLIEINYRLLAVLSRLGFSVGFGEGTIASLCREKGVDVNAFLLICNMYSFRDYVPTEEALKHSDPLVVLEYLHNSHSFYVDDGFAGLERAMNDLVAPCPDGQKKVMLKFLEDYRKEVENHFEYEENILFPYVRGVVGDGDLKEGYSIAQYEENHESIEEKLEDLKNIVMKYLPEICGGKLANLVLYHIFALAEDIARHTCIENSVLVPMVNRLEDRKREG